ncbi:uncharacterized protein K02A2.6-like [Phymastichus coffea]|uniref:uncharacterized protein K02A2.6-like n=1 Tax=Phymastichus coffea TaxID=108790 RepID=UPI00273A9A2E|nr:uncharacterized protein K02A2.6-like [Phymastichus coffea]
MAGKGYISSIVEYDLSEDWELWQERLEQFFTANDVEEEKKRVMYAYKPASKDYAVLTDILKKHLKPEPSEISERYTFKKCRQKEGDDIKSFVANLKKLSMNFLLAQSTEMATRDAEGMGESTEMAYSTAVNYVSDKKNKNLNQNDKTSDQQDNFEQEFNNLYHLSEDENKTKIKPLEIKVTVENVKIMFEIDTGSPITAMSSTYFFGRRELKCLRMYESNRIFKSYSGDTIVPIGLVKVDVLFANINCKLLLYVLPGNSKPILGRGWLDALGIIKNFECKLNEIKVISECESRYLAIVKEFKNVFTDKLGTYNRRTFKLELKPNVTPKFCKPRPVAYALREKVEAEIDRLIKSGVAEKVESSEWATPMVPIMKSNGQVRICGNYKITLNKHLIVNRHPIPRTQDLLAMLTGGTIFTRLDLMNAYQQFLLDDESQKLTTITTHKGLIRYKRLVFGVATAPGIFQGEIEELLKGILGVLKFFDDILITGKDVHEHDTRLREVLLRFNEVGLTVRKEKCDFAKSEIDFLGYTIDAEGIHVSEKKIVAIKKVEILKNVKELQVFLGMMNYHSKFIENYAFIVSLLDRLLRQDFRWKWTQDYHEAFEKAKASLSSDQVLIHYDTRLPIKITVDAGPEDIGAEASHIFPDGNCRPFAFASRPLIQAERNYS